MPPLIVHTVHDGKQHIDLETIGQFRLHSLATKAQIPEEQLVLLSADGNRVEDPRTMKVQGESTVQLFAFDRLSLECPPPPEIETWLFREPSMVGDSSQMGQYESRRARAQWHRDQSKHLFAHCEGLVERLRVQSVGIRAAHVSHEGHHTKFWGSFRKRRLYIDQTLAEQQKVLEAVPEALDQLKSIEVHQEFGGGCLYDYLGVSSASDQGKQIQQVVENELGKRAELAAKMEELVVAVQSWTTASGECVGVEKELNNRINQCQKYLDSIQQSAQHQVRIYSAVEQMSSGQAESSGEPTALKRSFSESMCDPQLDELMVDMATNTEKIKISSQRMLEAAADFQQIVETYLTSIAPLQTEQNRLRQSSSAIWESTQHMKLRCSQLLPIAHARKWYSDVHQEWQHRIQFNTQFTNGFNQALADEQARRSEFEGALGLLMPSLVAQLSRVEMLQFTRVMADEPAESESPQIFESAVLLEDSQAPKAVEPLDAVFNEEVQDAQEQMRTQLDALQKALAEEEQQAAVQAAELERMRTELQEEQSKRMRMEEEAQVMQQSIAQKTAGEREANTAAQEQAAKVARLQDEAQAAAAAQAAELARLQDELQQQRLRKQEVEDEWLGQSQVVQQLTAELEQNSEGDKMAQAAAEEQAAELARLQDELQEEQSKRKKAGEEMGMLVQQLTAQLEQERAEAHAAAELQAAQRQADQQAAQIQIEQEEQSRLRLTTQLEKEAAEKMQAQAAAREQGGELVRLRGEAVELAGVQAALRDEGEKRRQAEEEVQVVQQLTRQLEEEVLHKDAGVKEAQAVAAQQAVVLDQLEAELREKEAQGQQQASAHFAELQRVQDELQEEQSRRKQAEEEMQVVQQLTAQLEQSQSQNLSSSGAFSSCVPVSQDHYDAGDGVLFVRRVTPSGDIAFEAVCACPGAYYLHSQCLKDCDPEFASREFLRGHVVLQEETNGGHMLYCEDIQMV
eukprot:TRINITY_DN4810_c0_g2_i3.p1 TRINITY_DN4810_c0_g2~~TRINITY_DN4810_c0_g2_i3.p1  ORF type:complete len:967 (-),score=258.89 TRINITY_DN4810_c0_g2_i3:254-3154(-)